MIISDLTKSSESKNQAARLFVRIAPNIYAKPQREGYVFSKAIKNLGFIGIKDISEVYLPMGFSNFKLEGCSLGSALILEFLLYYMTNRNISLMSEKRYI